MRTAVAALAVLATGLAGASRCNGHSTPGPPNTHPIDEAPPIFVRAVPNGKLFHVGQGDDRKDLLHVWGTPYENGLAMGALLGVDRFAAFIRGVYTYTEGQIVADAGNATWCAAHAFRCAALRGALKVGLSAALDLSYERTKAYIKPYVMQEIRGLSDSTNGTLSVRDIRNVMWLGELTRGSCSMFGARDSATRSRGGKLLQLRALDWDVEGPFKNFAAIVVYHPNPGEGHAWANVGFAGFTASVTGFSEAQLGL
jgi:isopenicillin-N N-acyltransferase-like protein